MNNGREVDIEFQKSIEQWVSKAFKNKTLSLGELLKKLPGVYPTEAIHAIKRINKKNKKIRINPDLTSRSLTRLERQFILPVAHPKNYDWRFTEDTARFINTECEKYRGTKGKAALFGMPSVFRLANTLTAKKRYFLVDTNKMLIRSLGNLLLSRNVSNLTDDFKSELLVDVVALERKLEIIGEASRKISETFKKENSDIPWKSIIAQRNVMVHDYGQIKQDRIWGLTQKHIPELKSKLQPLLPPLPPQLDL